METIGRMTMSAELNEFPADSPLCVDRTPRTTVALVMRYFFQNGSVAAGARDLGIPVELFERYLRVGFAALLGQAFKYRTPLPSQRVQSPFELDAQELWKELERGSRVEPPEDEGTNAQSVSIC